MVLVGLIDRCGRWTTQWNCPDNPFQIWSTEWFELNGRNSSPTNAARILKGVFFCIILTPMDSVRGSHGQFIYLWPRAIARSKPRIDQRQALNISLKMTFKLFLSWGKEKIAPHFARTGRRYSKACLWIVLRKRPKIKRFIRKS